MLTRSKQNEIVSGLHLLLVRIGVAFTLLKVSLKTAGNPLKAITLIRGLLNERKTIHENVGEIKAVKAGSRYYWSANVPGWPSGAFEKFAENEFRRLVSPAESTLQTVIFGISSRCPLRCKHCYEWHNLSENELLTDRDLETIMMKIRGKDIRHIQFSGGEPLLRFDTMIKLMRLCGGDTDYWINTSGFGLTAGKAITMKENGMTGAIISLDYSDESRHNAFRQDAASFYWVKEAVKNCIESGMVVSLSLCPTREFLSVESLAEYAEFAKSLGVGFIRVLEPRPEGRFEGMDVRLNDEDADLLDSFVMKYNNGKVYRKYPVFQFPGHSQRKSGCLGAGNRYIYIDSRGDYHSCPFCRKPLGNAILEPLDAGILRARESGCAVFRQRNLS